MPNRSPEQKWQPPPCAYCDLGIEDMQCSCFDFLPADDQDFGGNPQPEDNRG